MIDFSKRCVQSGEDYPTAIVEFESGDRVCYVIAFNEKDAFTAWAATEFDKTQIFFADGTKYN